jgi:hypothetical protein
MKSSSETSPQPIPAVITKPFYPENDAISRASIPATSIPWM